VVEKRWQHEWGAAVTYQKSLLQLGFVDSLLGELTTRLRQQGMFDDTLIVLVSDHGASYRLGEYRRVLTASNAMDILPVLLLVKLPGQQRGVVSDRNVETVDILPTVADILRLRIDFPVHGQSAIDASLPQREAKWAQSADGDLVLNLPPSLPQMYDSLEAALALTGSGSDPVVLYGLGLRSDLLGKPAAHCTGVDPPGRQIIVDQMSRYRAIDFTHELLPLRISGRIVSPHSPEPGLDVAVALRGTIHAVGRTYLIDGSNEFAIVLPEDALQEGDNNLEVFVPADECRQ
jgi:hypothetical protein